MEDELFAMMSLEQLFEDKFKDLFFKERFKVLSVSQGYMPEFRYDIGEETTVKIIGNYDRKVSIIDVLPQKQNIKTKELLFFDNVNLNYGEIIDAYILKFYGRRQNEEIIKNYDMRFGNARDLEHAEKAIKIVSIGTFGEKRKEFISKEYYNFLDVYNKTRKC